MTTQIATTVEQSNKLIGLGLDPLTSDMSYKKTYGEIDGDYDWELFIGLDPAVRMSLFGYRKGYVVPSWSLSALLQLLPFPTLWQEMYGGMIVWRCQTTFIDGSEKYMSLIQETALDAAYECVVRLLENGYLKTNDNG